ncbi:MAG TPA: class I SAM-dependent methyltransferase, partial [Acidimicrobiia bacterium]|nr:class I SAM-dependent methyltransferase [Acidimicrobiia bacterium]
MSWSGLFEWWVAEIAEDPAYEEVVTPLLLEVLQPQPGRRYLDAGCGEGRVMRTVTSTGTSVVGLDLSNELVERAGSGVVADLVAMPLRDSSFDGVYSVLTLEHVEDHGTFYSEAARVTRSGGVLALVINHPIWTAP